MKIDETTCADDIRGVARLFYERYCLNSDNLNFRGEQCPAWPDLTPAVRSHWCAVAEMALNQSNYVAAQAMSRTCELFARSRLEAMRTRPTMYATTAEGFGSQLTLLAEIGGYPWPEEKSGLSPLAELMCQLYGVGFPTASMWTAPLDAAWATERADITLKFLEEKWTRATS